MIRVEENKITVREFNYLNESVGWGMRDEEIVKEALANTLYSISIFDDDKIIGFGRILGDKSIFLFIQDIMVIPDYQGQGIGSKIMESLLTKIDEYKLINPHIRTYLGASKGKEEFYKKFNFKTRKEMDLGEGMVLF